VHSLLSVELVLHLAEFDLCLELLLLAVVRFLSRCQQYRLRHNNFLAITHVVLLITTGLLLVLLKNRVTIECIRYDKNSIHVEFVNTLELVEVSGRELRTICDDIRVESTLFVLFTLHLLDLLVEGCLLGLEVLYRKEYFELKCVIPNRVALILGCLDYWDSVRTCRVMEQTSTMTNKSRRCLLVPLMC
jgi:hypothetical protein